MPDTSTPVVIDISKIRFSMMNALRSLSLNTSRAQTYALLLSNQENLPLEIVMPSYPARVNALKQDTNNWLNTFNQQVVDIQTDFIGFIDFFNGFYPQLTDTAQKLASTKPEESESLRKKLSEGIQFIRDEISEKETKSSEVQEAILSASRDCSDNFNLFSKDEANVKNSQKIQDLKKEIADIHESIDYDNALIFGATYAIRGGGTLMVIAYGINVLTLGTSTPYLLLGGLALDGIGNEAAKQLQDDITEKNLKLKKLIQIEDRVDQALAVLTLISRRYGKLVTIFSDIPPLLNQISQAWKDLGAKFNELEELLSNVKDPEALGGVLNASFEKLYLDDFKDIKALVTNLLVNRKIPFIPRDGISPTQATLSSPRALLKERTMGTNLLTQFTQALDNIPSGGMYSTMFMIPSSDMLSGVKNDINNYSLNDINSFTTNFSETLNKLRQAVTTHIPGVPKSCLNLLQEYLSTFKTRTVSLNNDFKITDEKNPICLYIKSVKQGLDFAQEVYQDETKPGIIAPLGGFDLTPGNLQSIPNIADLTKTSELDPNLAGFLEKLKVCVDQATSLEGKMSSLNTKMDALIAIINECINQVKESEENLDSDWFVSFMRGIAASYDSVLQSIDALIGTSLASADNVSPTTAGIFSGSRQSQTSESSKERSGISHAQKSPI